MPLRHRHVEARRALHEHVATVLASLDPDARRIVACAALLAYRIDPSFVAACAGIALDVALDALREAFQLGLVAGDDDAQGGYRFRHALVRDAVRAALAPAETRTLHRRIAATLERMPPRNGGTEELAYHVSAAGEAANDGCAHRPSVG